MYRQVFRGMSAHVIGLSCMALLSACTQSIAEGVGSNVGHKESSIGKYSVLTQAEMTQYISDMEYVHGLVRPDTPTRLNMADAKQYRFALARLKLAGKTPENSPYLLEALESRRQEHLAIGQTAGLLPGAEYTITGENEIGEMHYIEAATAGDTAGEGAASSTIPGGAFYTLVDTQYNSEGGLPLADVGVIEEFDGGYNATISTLADLTLTDVGGYTVGSYKIEDSAIGFFDSYVYTDIGIKNQRQRPVPPNVQIQENVHPEDIKFNDNKISVCLSRTWTGDCDYNLTGWATVKIPMKGSIEITTQHIFNEAEIQKKRNELNAGAVGDGYGHIKLVLANIGGGCNVGPDGALQASMKQFWNNVTLSADKKVLKWNMINGNEAFFDDSCRLVQDNSKLSLRIPLPILDELTQTLSHDLSVTLTNEPATVDPLYRYKPLRITNSCLAEGTMIQLAGGQQTPIEAIQSGAHVFNPFQPSERYLTVTDTAQGVEEAPMVRIEDGAGRELLMTEMHPIQTADRGMVQAKYLREGDVVMTTTGPSKLVEVTREKYEGKVYNLKVGAESEMASLGEDQTVVYANGFLVGDGQIQSKYETFDMTRKDGDTLERLPKRWHEDYLMSLGR